VKPLIRESNLTGTPTYYVITRYRVDPKRPNTIVATTKYDVTDQIEALFRDRATRLREPS
jgi:hypothetical protein